ncbi:MAG: response regulator [Deltaproteobacteria bacterium]|jgi:two-component system cell cycle sensor histidine kinase/response regulator CckA|nr:response regulator [Deltaproteobacteria bacterium]MBW2668773.1 response regulator [Deltaproteobacteria bacterium]
MGKMLVVDDEQGIRITLKEFLKEDGYEVHVAENADAAIKLLRQIEFDVVVSDIILPRVTGVDLLKAIREVAPYVKVIMMTGEPTVETAAESLRSGAFDYLFKPISKDVVLKIVRNALNIKTLEEDKRRLEEENRRYQENLEHLVGERTKALRDSENRLRTILDSIPVGVVTIDMETHKITDVNPFAARLLALPKEQIIGSRCYRFICPSEEGACPVTDQGERIENSESVLVLENGDKIPILRTVSRFMLGKREYLLESFIDLADRKKLETQLQQAQKMEAIGTLAGGVAHDFNNLLTSILGNSELALAKIDLDDPLHEEIEEIKNAGQRAAALTRQLLIFSRKQIIQPRILNLNEIISDIKKMLVRMIEEHIELKMNYAPDLQSVNIDPTQIEQVVFNLAANARDAMPSGGTLTIETENLELNEKHFQRPLIDKEPGPYIKLSIRDNGVGMDEETQTHIFEPFFTTKEIGKGTGLGMSTVYGIVKQNGGFIQVDSEKGRGTTFEIYLPAVEGSTEPKTMPSHEVSPGSESVLVVEDDHSLRKLVCNILEKYGYQVQEAPNGEEALKVIAENEKPIHLLVTDVIMPGMGGRMLAERLQSQQPDIKVLFMSGYMDQTISHQDLSAAELNFIEKPFSPQKLANKIREILDQN